MYVKTFKTTEEVNEFMDTLVNSEKNNIHYADGEYVVFYEHQKEGYEQHFVNQMISGLSTNLFHEKIRLASIDAEIKKMQESAVKSDKFDDAMKRQKDARDNVKIFEAKLEAMKSWTPETTSNE